MAYKMKSGRFRAVRMIDGVRRTATFPTKAEARQWEARQKAEDWRQAPQEILTAYSAASQYLDDVQGRMSRQVYVEKQSVFRLLFRTIDPRTGLPSTKPGCVHQFLDPQIGMEEVSTSHMAAFLGEQFKTRGGNAANGDRKNLSAWWAWAQRRLGVEKASPVAKIEKYPEERKPRVVPEEKHLRTLLNKERGEVRALLLTLLHTAARVGELFRMKWDDLDFERRTVRLWTRKRKGGGLEFDLIPMTEELRGELMEHKRAAKSVFVFCQENGQPLSHDMDIMDKLCAKHEVPRFGFHGIRHLSASMLDAAGVSLAVIQAILRHKSANTTAKYLHSLRGARVELGDVFSGKKKAPGGQTVSLSKQFGT